MSEESHDSDNVDNKARKMYTDTKTGYWGKTKMLKKYSTMLDKMKSMQRHKIRTNRMKRKLYRYEISPSPFHSVQIDLAFLPKLKSPKNNNVVGFIVVIDVFSRYLWVETFTTRKDLHESLDDLIKQMINEFNKSPTNMTGDNEFATTKMQALAAKYDFKWWFGDAHEKYRTGICERVIRTIKNLIKRYLVENNTSRYVDVLSDLVYNYNNTIHRTINTTPAFAIKSGKIDDRRIKNKIEELNIGDIVRVEKKRDAFTKGDVPYFSGELYEIIGRERNRYVLKNIKTNKKVDKLYAIHQLLKVDNVQNNKPQPIDKPDENDNYESSDYSDYDEEIKENARINRNQRVMKRNDIDVKNIIKENERDEMDKKLYGRRSDKKKPNPKPISNEPQLRRSNRVRKQPDRYEPAPIRKPIAKPVPPKPIAKPDSDSDSSSSSSSSVDIKPTNEQIRRRKMIQRRRRMMRNKIKTMKSNDNNINNNNLRRSTRIRKAPVRYKP